MHDATCTGRGVLSMRYKAILLVGLVVGFIAGARAGRERYDQLVRVSRRAIGHPAVQNAKMAAAAKATDLTKAAAAKAPDLAKSAAAAAKQAGQQAVSHLPFTGKTEDATDEESADEECAPLPFQTDGSPATFNGVRAD